MSGAHVDKSLERQTHPEAVKARASRAYARQGHEQDEEKLIIQYLPLVRHMHLKDFSGGQEFLGYCPLGQGKVDIPAILDAVEGGKQPVNIMVELDPSPKQPITALETAKIAKAYLEKQGYKFRS